MPDQSPPDHKALTSLYGDWIKRMALLLKARMPWADLDEMLQWGAVGMMEASQRFDPSHGVAFQAFAARRIKGAMIDGLRREGARRRDEAVLDPEVMENTVKEDSYGQVDPLSLLARTDNYTLLVAALKTLPELEYRILALHFYNELNNREIAAVLDISEGYASRLRKRALELLGTHMNAAQSGETMP